MLQSMRAFADEFRDDFPSSITDGYYPLAVIQEMVELKLVQLREALQNPQTLDRDQKTNEIRTYIKRLKHHRAKIHEELDTHFEAEYGEN